MAAMLESVMGPIMSYAAVAGGGGQKSGSKKLLESDGFVAEFCDHFADDISRASHEPYDTIIAFQTLLDNLLNEVQAEEFSEGLATHTKTTASGSGHEDMRSAASFAIRQFSNALDNADTAWRKLQLYTQNRAAFHLSRVVDEVCRQISGIRTGTGEIAVVPLFLPSLRQTSVAVVEAHPTDPSQLRLTLVNPSSKTRHHPMTVSPDNHAKIRQQIALTFGYVPRKRLCSEAFWSCVYVTSSKLDDDDYFYSHFLSWLVDKPFHAKLAESLEDATPVFGTPARSSTTTFWKGLVHALKYVFRSAGLTQPAVKFVRMHLKVILLRRVAAEVEQAKALTTSEGRLVHAAAQSTAAAIARNHESTSAAYLSQLKQEAENTTALAERKSKQAELDAAPPKLDLDNGWDKAQQPDTYPLMECFRRIESVDQFAGAKVTSIKASAINFLQERSSIASLDDVVSCVNHLAKVALQLASADFGSLAKNTVPLALSMINHTVLNVLPMPLGPKSRATGRHDVWSEPMRYGQQLQLLKRLHEVTELYAYACVEYAESSRCAGLRMTVFGALACMADSALRSVAIDDPSPVSQVLAGVVDELAGEDAVARPFMWTPGHFARESAISMFTIPEAMKLRAQLLDYTAEHLDTAPATQTMWKWEENAQRCSASERYIRALCTRAGIYLGAVHPLTVFCGADQGWGAFGVRYCTEMRYLRDIVMYFKLFTMEGTGIPPSGNHFKELSMTMNWQYNDQEGIYCYAFGGQFMNAKGTGRKNVVSMPSTYTHPSEVTCEDDLLHIKNLPTFDNAMGQRDSELLLSYLTTPYLRIPLLLRFFSTEDRISCLRSVQVVNILTHVLFEPGRFLPFSLSNVCPEQVPSEDAALISTPYGLLVNELQHSPNGVIEPLVRMVGLARELDAGTVFNDSVAYVILLLAKTVARVENYVAWTLEHARDPELRDVKMTKEGIANLQQARDKLSALIREQLVPMLERWTEEALQSTLQKETPGGRSIDAIANITGKLHSHVALLLRNVDPADYDETFVTSYLATFTYLTTRFSFDLSESVSPLEIFEIAHRHRRFVAMWLHQADPAIASRVFDNAVRVATGAYSKNSGAASKSEAVSYRWGVVAGSGAIGRFARLDDELLRQSTQPKAMAAGKQLNSLLARQLGIGEGDESPNGAVPVVEGTQEVEINLQTMCLTFKSAHLHPLGREMVEDTDVQTVFGPMFGGNTALIASLQCAIVEEGEHRSWVRLVGQDHDIQHWRTMDPRYAIPTDLMRFFPDDLTTAENWIYELFEPLRAMHFERSFWEPPIFIMLPDKKLSPDTSVAALTAVCSKTGRKLKEIYVFRDYRCVHVYDVMSHGRRFYRSLVYSTDTRFTLHELQPSTEDRYAAWAPWARHSGGEPNPDKTIGRPQTVVVLRHAGHPMNKSKSTETFIPRRFLHGLIPATLLDAHAFWQDADDNLRGYPEADDKGEMPQHLLWVHWREADFDPLSSKNTCARVYRFAHWREAPRSSERAILRSQLVKTNNAVDDELEMVRTATNEDETLEEEEQREREAAALDEGMYRESSMVAASGGAAKSEAATVEDHNMMLLDLQYARSGTPLHSLARVLARLELLSHVLVWTTATDHDGTGSIPVSLVQLPRLKLSFAAREGPDGSVLLHSLDHAHLFISNDRPALVVSLMQGVPHSVLLADASSAFSILVPSLAVVRPSIQRAPFSTELVINRKNRDWYTKLDTRYYLYQVHVSLSFMFTPTLASALYLLLLRFYHRDYTDVFRLAGTIGTDMQLNAEEAQIFNGFANISDSHPNAFACRARISLLVSDAPVLLGWYAPSEVANMIACSSHVSVSCRLTIAEERRLLYYCDLLEKKMAIVREFATKTSKDVYKFAVKKAMAATKSADKSEKVKKAPKMPGGALGQFTAFGAQPTDNDDPFAPVAMNQLGGFGMTLALQQQQQRLFAQANAAGGAVGNTSEVDDTQQRRRQLRAFNNQLTVMLRERLDVRVLLDDLHRLVVTFHNLATRPMSAYLTCTLANRREVLEAELKAAENGGVAQPAKLRVPEIAEDLNWLFYRDYSPLTIKTGPPPPRKNDEGRPVRPSTQFEYWYCRSNVRAANQCHCRGCPEMCGIDESGVGCPCASCERFNNKELLHLRHVPDDTTFNRSQRTITFYDGLAWIGELAIRAVEPGTNRNPIKAWQERHAEASMREESNHFLRYYEILTGTTRVRIGSQPDCGKDLVQLLFPFNREARNPASGLGDMFHFVLNTPFAWSKLPKYQRQSKSKMPMRLGTIYNALLEQAALHHETTKPVDISGLPKYEHKTEIEVSLAPRPDTRDATTPLRDTTILPFPRNTDQAALQLSPPRLENLRLLGDEKSTLEVGEAVIEELCEQPLRSTLPTDLLRTCSRDEQELQPVPEELPFDLRNHQDASKAAARDMLSRLESDMLSFSTQANTEQIPKITGLVSAAEVRRVLALPRDEAVGVVEGLVKRINAFVDDLQALRKGDVDFVAYAMPAIRRTANHVHTGAADTDRASDLVMLRRFADKEAFLSVEYIVSSLCSTTATTEWRQLNPFLPQAAAESLVQLVLLTVLRANRTGHVNRTMEAARDLIAILERVSSVIADGTAAMQHKASYVEALVASLCQKADHLAGVATAKRVYAKKVNEGVYTLDPRFVLFEFTWNLVLRDRQRELVNDMYTSIVEDRSIVKQMIMGAGKTTVVGPLLALMLADSKNLVVQVVPPALLDFTRAVLRTTFSSVLQKQIFTFTCDRSSEIDSELISKFLHAKQARGIVVTTPSSIKSVYLKYVEALDRITDSSRKRSSELEKEAKDMLGVLNMWRDGVLIMDEVDMLLHPLKSELNFPIGAKHEIDFTPTRWKLPIHLIDALFYHHTRRITVNMKDTSEAHAILSRFSDSIAEGLTNNALQEMPHLTLLNLEFYDTKMKPILAEWLLLFLKAQHLVGLNEQSTLRYLLRRPTNKDDPEFVKVIESLDPDHVKMLNFAHDWLSSFLPHVMQKIDRVSFGIMNADDIRRAREEHPNMPRSRFVTAIPFIGKDLPSQSSEFAHPDVVIGLTVLAYRYEGMRHSDFTDIMRDVHAMVEKEVGRFQQRKTNIMYNKWVQAAGGTVLQNFSYSKKKVADDEDDSEDGALTRQLSSTRQLSVQGSAFATDGDQVALRCVLPLKLMKQSNQEESNKLFKLFGRCAEVIHWYLCESIFPEFMRHQLSKLSASGQELGGSSLFKRRVGFSGTPSDLLPIELGKCDYEHGTDGQLIHTLTNPTVVSCVVKQPGWTVASLLDYVAHANPPFHALIDTGALITGMSNLQVARYLLKHGLNNMEGVVFLDEFDRKMILVRATGRVLKLAECGIPKVKRFAFYDQVHTTGMDIEHTPNAMAIQTLGKDMTFRDFSQGAYRMRGIGQGQTVQLLVIPEVYDLMLRSLAPVRKHPVADDHNKRAVAEVLVDITAWLLLNSIRSEHTQHNQLALQSCANVWRKHAFETLRDRLSEFRVENSPSDTAMHALKVFQEPVDFAVRGSVPQPMMFSDCIQSFVDHHNEFIVTDDARSITHGLVARARAEDELNKPVIDVQMVQEQEEEKEQELEKDQEREIEMEKFVDLAYSRDAEHGTPWKLTTLAGNVSSAPQFYSLSSFHLYKRRPLSFPDSIMLSRNYFDPRWGGHRRIKNVIVTMEWIPERGNVAVRTRPSEDYGCIPADDALATFRRTIDQLVQHQGALTSDLARDVFATALHCDISDSEWSPVWDTLRKSLGDDSKKGDIAATLYGMLCSNALRNEQDGRFTVAVTLEEAETLRRVIHLRNMQGDALIPGTAASIALHVVPSNNALLDQLSGHVEPPTPYQRVRNFQSLRFFDCDLQFSDSEFGQILRALHGNAEKVRQAFFSQVITCRRRARQRWERTPIAQLFVTATAFTLLHQKALGLCMRKELEARELHLADAFLAFNNSHSGVLTPDEVWGAMLFCRLQLAAGDVLDFVDFADSNKEGNILYPDFLCALTGSRDIEDDEGGQAGGDDQQTKKLPTVNPHGAEELKALSDERAAARRQAEEEANRELGVEQSRVMDEIEADQIREELEALRLVRNPRLESKTMTFSFQHEDRPKLISTFGPKVCKYVEDDARSILMGNNSGLRASLRTIKSLRGPATEGSNASLLTSYTLSFDFRFPRPLVGDTKMLTLSRLSALGQHFTLATWQLPFYVFSGGVNIDFEEKLFEKEAGGTAGNDDDDAAALAEAGGPKFSVSGRNRGDDEEGGGMFSGGRGGKSKAMPAMRGGRGGGLFNPQPTFGAQPAFGGMPQRGGLFGSAPKPFGGGGFGAGRGGGMFGGQPAGGFGQPGGFGAPGGFGGQAASPFAVDGIPRADEKTMDKLHVFSRPDPTLDNIVGVVPAGTEVEATGEMANTTIDGVSVEWMRIRAVPKADVPEGYVVKMVGTVAVWKQSSAALRLDNEGKVVLAVESAQTIEGAQGAIQEEMDDEDALLLENKGDQEEEQGGFDFTDMALMGDVGDLLEAVKKARLLIPGDKVQRNPDSWSRGNEDGGEGKTGRVLKVEGESVVVQWPSGAKGQYAWGAAGKFELIKVGDAEDGEDGEVREVLNDDRWSAELRTPNATCAQCSAPKLEPGNWYRCNHCDPAVHLCKKCFQGGAHNEHDFTDMKALLEEIQERATGGLSVGCKARLKLKDDGLRQPPTAATAAASSEGSAVAASPFGAAPAAPSEVPGFGAPPAGAPGGFGVSAFAAKPAVPADTADAPGAEPNPFQAQPASSEGSAFAASPFGASSAAPSEGTGFGAPPAASARGGFGGAAFSAAPTLATPSEATSQDTAAQPAPGGFGFGAPPPGGPAGFGAAAPLPNPPTGGLFGAQSSAFATAAPAAGGFGEQPVAFSAAPAAGFGEQPVAFNAAPQPAGGFGGANAAGSDEETEEGEESVDREGPFSAAAAPLGAQHELTVPAPGSRPMPAAAPANPPPGAVGTVVDIDKDSSTITLDIPNFGEWSCPIADVILVTEEDGADAGGDAEDSSATGIKQVPALQFLLGNNRNLHGLKRIVDAAQRPTRYVVGDMVRYRREGGGFFGSNQQGTVRAVVQGGDFYVIETDGESKSIAKDMVDGLLPFKQNDKVRLKRTATTVCAELPEHLRHKAVGKVVNISTFGDNTYVGITYAQAQGIHQAPAHEIELVDDNYQWFVRLAGENEAPISAGAAVSLERGFQDGEKTVGFLFKDRPLVADFSSFKVFVQSGSDGSSTGDPVGTLRRDPDEQWTMAEEKKVFDDGNWHVLTLIVKDNIIAAVCDGEKIPVRFEGSLVQRMQELVGEAIKTRKDDASPDEEPKPVEKRTLASHVPLVVNTPITFMYTPMTADEFRKQSGMQTGNTFPRRLVGHISVSWDAIDVNDVIAQQVMMDTVYGWTCKSCRELNSRQADTCAQCGDARTEKKGARDGVQGKVRAVNPRSREAQAVRRRVQNKLRSQYQRILDSYDDTTDRRGAVDLEDLL